MGAAEPEPRPFLCPLFADSMVLQRGKPNPIWGWTKPGEGVRVEAGGKSASATAGPDGKWTVRLDPPPTGPEYTVTITGSQTVQLHHVLVGDVWICGGQSNMAIPLAWAKDGQKEVAAADHPNIRFFIVGAHPSYGPTEVPKGSWKVCTPETVAANGGFSAVAYFFATKVQAATSVPLGLVEDCMGGTPAETWMNPETLRGLDDFKEPMAEVDRLLSLQAPDYGNYIMHWYDAYDPGIRGTPWSDPAIDDHAWTPVGLPDAFATLGLADVPSVVWFRKEFTLPDPVPKGGAVLKLGVVEKMETSYVNGTWVGASSWVENPRIYRVPESALRPGRNVLALRVFKLKSKAAFLTDPAKLELDLPGGQVLPLASGWKAAVAVDARPPHPLPLGFENYPTVPSVLFQGMIRPVAPLAITGALWYQGEANASRAHQYRTLLPRLIGDWRAAFGQGDFPFLIAGLPAFQDHRDTPGSDGWAELREAQALTAQNVPNTGLAVTIDTGEAANIHPREKRPVGERLALLALANVYGQKVVSSGPTFASMERKGNTIVVHFDHTEGGLVVKGDSLGEFSVAAEDKAWHWATAKLQGDEVEVTSPEVIAPVAVRYAWQSNPKATLFNVTGLPAPPFRTDDWPGVTDHADPW